MKAAQFFRVLTWQVRARLGGMILSLGVFSTVLIPVWVGHGHGNPEHAAVLLNTAFLGTGIACMVWLSRLGAAGMELHLRGIPLDRATVRQAAFLADVAPVLLLSFALLPLFSNTLLWMQGVLAFLWATLMGMAFFFGRASLWKILLAALAGTVVPLLASEFPDPARAVLGLGTLCLLAGAWVLGFRGRREVDEGNVRDGALLRGDIGSQGLAWRVPLPWRPRGLIGLQLRSSLQLCLWGVMGLLFSIPTFLSPADAIGEIWLVMIIANMGGHLASMSGVSNSEFLLTRPVSRRRWLLTLWALGFGLMLILPASASLGSLRLDATHRKAALQMWGGAFWVGVFLWAFCGWMSRGYEDRGPWFGGRPWLVLAVYGVVSMHWFAPIFLGFPCPLPPSWVFAILAPVLCVLAWRRQMRVELGP